MKRFAALSTLSAVLFAGVAVAQDDHHNDQRDSQNSQRDNQNGPRDNNNQGNYHNDQANHDQRDNHTYVKHEEWHKGARINHDDWQRGEVVDYRAQHLKAPRRGYEWRQVDGNYVLAAVATGLIASAIVAGASH